MGQLHSGCMNIALHTGIVAAAAIISASDCYSECLEYNIIEHEDRVEAVCVGKPLTAAEEKARQEEERKEQLKAEKEKVAEQREAARLSAEQSKANESKRTAEKEAVKPINRREKALQQKGTINILGK